METARVPVVSAWLSKINWTQAVAALSALLTVFGLNLTPEVQTTIVTLILLGTNFVTWVLRTWFNGSVNPASLPEKK